MKRCAKARIALRHYFLFALGIIQLIVARCDHHVGILQVNFDISISCAWIAVLFVTTIAAL